MFSIIVQVTPIELIAMIYDVFDNKLITTYTEPCTKETLADSDAIRSFYASAVYCGVDALDRISNLKK